MLTECNREDREVVELKREVAHSKKDRGCCRTHHPSSKQRRLAA
jgi:hypothetical protein